MRELKILPYYCLIFLMTSFFNTNCAGSKSMNSSNEALNIDPANSTSLVASLPQSQIISNVEKNKQRIAISDNNKSLEKNNENLKPKPAGRTAERAAQVAAEPMGALDRYNTTKSWRGGLCIGL